jgi:hypothetical protein
MFSAYMQEVNFNLFYLCFCLVPQVCTGNSTLRMSGVVPWRGNVSNIILLHTHTHTHTAYFLNTSLTTFLFSPLAVHKWRFALPPWTETVSAIPVYRLALLCPVYTSRGGVENLRDIFPYTFMERVTKTEIFQQFS